MTPTERLLQRALEMLRDAQRQQCQRAGLVYAGSPDFVLQHGTWYAPAPLTFRERGAPKMCFGNAIMLAVKRPELVYVEGYALSPVLAAPIHHAWNATPAGELVDITWRNEGLAYLGVVFSVERADDATWHGDASVLDDWKRRWPLLRQRWEGERPIEGYTPSEALLIAKKIAARGLMFTKGKAIAPESAR